MRVLFVEDSAFMREMMTAILQNIEIGHIVCAFNGEQAMVEIMNRNSHDDSGFDVIISDWAMRTMTGIELLKWVRGNDDIRIKYLPFIMLTAYSTADWVCRARDWGATEFLTKPISAQSVAHKLLSVIERPRPFIRSLSYFGPDRRRHGGDVFSGTNRRGQPAL